MSGVTFLELDYEMIDQIETRDGILSWVLVILHTGRHHQIRVQFAHAGFPLYADTKYGQPLPKGAYCPVALCSCRIEFTHPGNGNKMEFSLGDDCLNDLLSQAAPPTV